MLHILAFALIFPAMCLLVVAVAGRFQMITDIGVLLVAIPIVYALTIVPGAITAVADYLMSRRGIRLRFLYGALLAAVVTPLVALSIYPGASSDFRSNAAICAAIGAASAMLCSWLVAGLRSYFGRP